MRKIIGLLFIIMASVQSAHAFDDSRKGFFIGVGGGAHSTSSDVGSSDSRNGLALSFKIGGGFTDKFVLYYVRNTAWYDDEYTFALGVAGIGASYFFSPSASSLYIHGGVGAGDLSAPLDTDVIDPETGTGYLVGAGYQFSNSLTVEGTYMAVDIDIAELTSYQVLFNYLWY